VIRIEFYSADSSEPVNRIKSTERRIMVACPKCDAPIDVEEEELDEGDVLSCDECGASLTVASVNPVEIQSEDEEEEDEDEDFDFDEDEEDEEEEEEEEEDWH
jgi:alpha-aminoadipate/glutamate carrier protein LysW